MKVFLYGMEESIVAGLLRLGLSLPLLLLKEVAVSPVARRTRTNVTENRFLDLGRLIGKQF